MIGIWVEAAASRSDPLLAIRVPLDPPCACACLEWALTNGFIACMAVLHMLPQRCLGFGQRRGQAAAALPRGAT